MHTPLDLCYVMYLLSLCFGMAKVYKNAFGQKMDVISHDKIFQHASIVSCIQYN